MAMKFRDVFSYLVVLLEKLGVEILRYLTVDFVRDDIGSACLPDHVPYPVGIVGLVRQHRLAWLQPGQQVPANRRVMILPGCEFKLERQAGSVNQGMGFRCESAP